MRHKIKKKIKVLGIMNGTSLDGVDVALIEADESFKKIRFLEHKQKAFPTELRKSLLKAARNEQTVHTLSLVHFKLGAFYGKLCESLLKTWKFDLVGLHGQTVHHQGQVASLQIGHPGYIVEKCGKPVIYDFRSADLIAGGEAAPFAPFFQKFLAQQNNLKKGAFHNLGGISNLTFFEGKKSVAFDTGPANILLDAWMQKHKKKDYDRKGQVSATGLPDPLVVSAFLKHPFFKKRHPKSTGREDFNLDFIKKWGGSAFMALSFEDQMATLTELTALSIAKAYKMTRFRPHTIYFYGGGTYNDYLMERLNFYLQDSEIKFTDDLGWPRQAFEASTFAFLAAARYYDKKVHIPEVTGAKGLRSLGAIYG